MLKTNSKQAIENIRYYIKDNFECSNYEPETVPETFGEIARFIYDCFVREFWNSPEDFHYWKTEQNAFINWCQGLPSVLNCCYYYNRSAVADLGIILEETETERRKYSESAAAQMLSSLIYREIKKEVSR